jgi:hypothetical protein
LKNQYFGDINDYRKYGLLRGLLAGGASSILVAWMLTPNDGRSDGLLVQYLRKPEKWRGFDPELFTGLSALLRAPRPRSVALIEHSGLLPRCRFFSDVVGDRRDARTSYFQQLARAAPPSDLVFLDPDNGLEVKSVPPGRRGSCKYLYWHEVQELFSVGCSLLIYQHFPRVDRNRFVTSKARELARRVGIRSTLTFRSPQVLFLLAAQPRHRQRLRPAAEALAPRWADQIQYREVSTA